MRGLIYKVAAFVLVLSCFTVAWVMMDYQQFADNPITASEEGVRFDINSGDTLTKVSKKLHQSGVLSHAKYLVWMARLQGSANTIKTGEYLFKVGTNPRQLLEGIVKGSTIQYSATIIEGLTFRETLALLKKNENLVHTLKGLSNKKIMSKLGYKGEHPEGRFLPDTYYFPKGTTDVEFLQRAYQAMQVYLQEQWEQKDYGLPFKNPYEALIMASIVEKETGLASERQQIAGVFIRRMEKRMLLQTDPTVIYGIGSKFDGNLRRRDLRKDTPYNTYRRKGLPPTPIALPGKDAIYAAMHPADGKELYFVARGDGSHEFNETLRQHNNAVIKFQLKGKRKPFSSMPRVKKTKK